MLRRPCGLVHLLPQVQARQQIGMIPAQLVADAKALLKASNSGVSQQET